MSDRLRIALAWLPAAVYMAAIWVASSMEMHRVDISSVPMQDKGVHFLEFAVLGVLVAHAALRTWQGQPSLRPFLVAVVVTCAWGLLDELHQSFVPGRSAEMLDVFADATGAVVGSFFRVVLGRVIERRSEAPS